MIAEDSAGELCVVLPAQGGRFYELDDAMSQMLHAGYLSFGLPRVSAVWEACVSDYIANM